MSEMPPRLTRLALATSSRAAHVLAPVIACFALALVLPPGLLGLAFLVAGATLLFMTGLILWLVRRYRKSQEVLWQTAAALNQHDAVPCFGTDDTGRILHRNPAANRRFPGDAAHLSGAIAELFAAPQSVIQRLRMKADDQGAASEDISATRGALRISAHRIDQVGYLWRIEDRIAVPDTAGAAKVALPMMRVSKANTILDMNEAMHELLGGRPKSLDRVVRQLPLQADLPTQLETAAGPVEAQLALVEDEDGLTQVYVWPGAAPKTEMTHADALPVPLMRISPSGRILMANPRARSLLALEDTTDLDFAEVVEGLGRPIDEWLLDISEGRGTGRTEVVRATRPSQDVYLQVALGRMVDRDQVSILAVLIDATELKTLEAQFVQSQKMQAIGQLAGGVAHDFNNLLTAISGHCDLLLLRHEPGDPNYGDLVQINQNANRAASLVGQLLAFSRKQNMQPELIDLRDTLGDLTHLLNRLVGEKINLHWTHDPDLPWVRADKRQLEQVLMNLVVNARDAMPGGGQITVETRTAHLTEPLQRERAEVPVGDYVVVTVQDEGCGIAGDKLPKIFEPFYSTKRLGEGTGLGLSMAYGIVKQSGGFIFADSEVGRGSTFTMYFPAHHASAPDLAEAAVERKRPSNVGDGGVVLLVEDEAPVRAFASRALRLRGYTVLEADCAEQALQTLEDGSLRVDVFVTDVVMPGMDGPSWVTQALKQRPGVKVVFVSGYAEDAFGHNRAKIPNSVFLPKPFSLSQLTETVRNQLY
ncbi:MAG: response regulator [Rhodobacter sp.]|nr:response regulator [Rhodobacter sp.]